MKIKISKFVNNKCISFGICWDYSYEYIIEISFFFWDIDISFKK